MGTVVVGIIVIICVRGNKDSKGYIGKRSVDIN